jgi:hypothetical protein
MWVPRGAAADGQPKTASESVCSTACNATAPERCGSIRQATTVRRDQAGNPRGQKRSARLQRRANPGPGWPVCCRNEASSVF